MKHTKFLLIALAVAILSAAQVTVTPALAQNRNTRSSAKVLDKNSQGSQVYVYGHQVGVVRATNQWSGGYRNPRPASAVRYYTNSAGRRVQSPTYYPSAPRGATARCVDGTYSFSQNRRGTCSHHGDVAQWLR